MGRGMVEGREDLISAIIGETKQCRGYDVVQILYGRSLRPKRVVSQDFPFFSPHAVAAVSYFRRETFAVML